MSPIWCSSLLIDGPLLGFCVWSNILSLSSPSGYRIQTNNKSPQSLEPTDEKKMISAEIVCICDQNQILKQVHQVKMKTSIQEADMILAHVNICLYLTSILGFMSKLRCFCIHTMHLPKCLLGEDSS